MKNVSVCLLLLLWLATGGARADTSNASPITADEVKNAPCCIPSMGDAADKRVTFKDGSYTSKDTPTATIGTIAVGDLDGSPAAVAQLDWSTGGSGGWEAVVLFRRVNGHVGSHGIYIAQPDLPSGSTGVGKIEIKDNKILLYGDDPAHNKHGLGPLVRTSSVFKLCKLKK